MHPPAPIGIGRQTIRRRSPCPHMMSDGSKRALLVLSATYGLRGGVLHDCDPTGAFIVTHHAFISTPHTQPLKIGMVLYPGFTLLDLAGPQAALGMNGQTLLLWKNLEPVAADSGVGLCPTTTFDGCREDLDVLLVPGGFGTNEAMKDAEIVDFLARVGPTARYVNSVCSGSLVLGMAGLLDG